MIRNSPTSSTVTAVSACRYTAPFVLAFRWHLVMWHQKRLVVSHRKGYSEISLPLPPEVAARRRSRLQNCQGSRLDARRCRIQDHLSSPPFNEETTNYIPAGYGSPGSSSSWSSSGLTNDTEFSDEFDRRSCFMSFMQMNSMKLKIINEIRTKRRIDGTAIHQVTGINRDSHLCFLTCQKKIHQLNKDKFVTVTDINPMNPDYR